MNEQEWEELPEGQDLEEEEGAAGELETADTASETAGAYLEPADAESSKVDLNTATEQELRQLPGIGDALAARIVEYRSEVGPFTDPAEITAVTGVSEAMYARLGDRLSAGPVEPDLASETAMVLPESATAEEEPAPEVELQVDEVGVPIEPEPATTEQEVEEPEGVPLLVREPIPPEAAPAEAPEPELDVERVVKAPPRGPEPPLVEVVQARYGCGRLILVGLLSIILGAALALGAMFLINGTLDFQAAAVRAAQDEVLRMEGLVGALDMKVVELEERVGVMQELEARLTDTQGALRRLSADLDDVKQRFDSLAETQDALRQEFTNLREDMDGLAEHVSVLDRRLTEAETQIAYLNRRIEILDESVQRFDEFLAGLQALLNASLGALPPTPTPWITPTDTPWPAPTAWETPTLRPAVTVIPLATPTPPTP